MLRQSDRATPSVHLEDIQSEQGLLQACADNQDIPGGVVESFHGGWAVEKEVLFEAGHAKLASLLT